MKDRRPTAERGYAMEQDDFLWFAGCIERGDSPEAVLAVALSREREALEDAIDALHADGAAVGDATFNDGVYRAYLVVKNVGGSRETPTNG